MTCLCCGKPIPETASESEREGRWHTACVRKFFGSTALPELDLSDDTLTQLAIESTNRGFTVPGVQKKMSLHLTRYGEKPRLTLVNYPTGYILKPQTELYPALPEAEYLVMQMAERTGIATVPFAMLGLEGSLAYITRRIDRTLPRKRKEDIQLLAMEDFCQLEQRLTEDKYRGSYERCAKVISQYSCRPGLDLSELFLRIVFSFAIGNSDMHLKNFSLIETTPGSQEYVLSEAYDMLPVNVIVPEDEEQLALTLNGKKRSLRRNDFLKFADAAGITREAAVKMIQKVISLEPVYLQMCAESALPSQLKERLMLLIPLRLQSLTPGHS